MAERNFIVDADSEVLPDADEVYGHEGDDVVIMVRNDGPVRVEELPTHIGGIRTVVAEVSTPIKILNNDPRRKRALLMSRDQEFYFAATQAQCNPSYAGFWFSGIPLELSNQDELWVASADAVAVATITVVNELWTR